MGISQEEIVTNAQTVTKGLEALRLEHQSLLGGLKVGDNLGDRGGESDGGAAKENEALIEKCSLLEVNFNQYYSFKYTCRGGIMVKNVECVCNIMLLFF